MNARGLAGPGARSNIRNAVSRWRVETARENEERRLSALREFEERISSAPLPEVAEVIRSDQIFRSLPRGTKHVAYGLACACLIAQRIVGSEEPQAVIASLARNANFRPRKDTDGAMLAVRLVFDYGSTPEELRSNRQYASIHARAVRYLLKEAMTPERAYRVLQRRESAPTVLAERYSQWRSGETQKLPPSPSARRKTKSDNDVTVGGLGLALRESEGPKVGVDSFLAVIRQTDDGYQFAVVEPFSSETIDAKRAAKEVRDLAHFLRHGRKRFA